MYNLFYWAYNPRLMCTFNDYATCKEAMEKLKQKYPTARVWMDPVVPINSLQEWEDKFNCHIPEYENKA